MLECFKKTRKLFSLPETSMTLENQTFKNPEHISTISKRSQKNSKILSDQINFKFNRKNQQIL